MRRALPWVLLATSLGGGVAYYNDVELPAVGQASGWLESAPSDAADDARLMHTAEGTIKLGSFHVDELDVAKLNRAPVAEVLAAVARRFDVLALQGVRSESQDVLPRLMEWLNAEGGQYDYVIGPRVGRGWDQRQMAIVFDTGQVEIDRSAIYTVDDPDDLLEREPLVAAFRTRRVSEDAAFTFTLINADVSQEHAERELKALGDVYRAVKADGRGEDDVILTGTLWREQGRLSALEGLPSQRVVPADLMPSGTAERVVDHFVFQELATVEFSGGGGFVDLMAEFGLDEVAAANVSRHVPIWVEFSVYEGGRPERLVGLPSEDESR